MPLVALSRTELLASIYIDNPSIPIWQHQPRNIAEKDLNNLRLPAAVSTCRWCWNTGGDNANALEER